ncbi:phage antirepressor N-terminal domain-containing protein [Leptothrix discophora]|uniref:Phage antirepressor N-terminal domain-containing protein n=1 Tax=Leptothrix discophora TaxID=89 RepID=A0ABT9G1H7_LEPDI|nr:phage antirepressor N-terminal domain-containing protein [Leptothrix discophora]MDP4300354.1 phage antirepressor N-terminal domain-containing protein [Leptothrix discophora]
MADHLISITFHGAPILAMLVNGVPHVSVRSICEALGIDAEAQRLRIKRHSVLSSVACVTKAPAADGKSYDTLCLPLDKLNGWLFGISAARVRPELRERLIAYQRECFDVLARHFGAAQPGALIPAEPPRRRWLTEQHGHAAPVTVSLGDDVQVGTWLELAGVLIHAAGLPGDGTPSHADALALASAATQVAALTAHTLPKGRGEDIARAIHADASLSLADLHRIAEMASTELWVRTRQAVRARGQDADRAWAALKATT